MGKPSAMYFLKNVLVFLCCVIVIKKMILLFVNFWSLPYFLLMIAGWVICEVLAEKCYPLGEHGVGSLFVKDKE